MLSHLIALGVLLKSPDFIIAQSLFPSDLRVNEVNVDGSTQAKNPRKLFQFRKIFVLQVSRQGGLTRPGPSGC